MAVVTPKAVSDRMSCKVQVKAITEENRLVRVDRFLTTIGDVEVKLSHELNPGTCMMDIPNNTCKIVLQMQERCERRVLGCEGCTKGNFLCGQR